MALETIAMSLEAIPMGREGIGMALEHRAGAHTRGARLPRAAAVGRVSHSPLGAWLG